MATPERVKPPQERQVAILERIATHAPLADTLDELVAFLEAQIPGAIGSLPPLAHAWDELVASLEPQTPAAIGSLLLLEDDGRHLRIASARGLPADYNAR